MTLLILPNTWHGRETMEPTLTTGRLMISPSVSGTIMFGTSSNINSNNSQLIQPMIGHRALLSGTRPWIRQKNRTLLHTLTMIITVRHRLKVMPNLSLRLQRQMSNMKTSRPQIGTDAPCSNRSPRWKRHPLIISVSTSELVRAN